MKNSPCENKIVLGRETTKGLGPEEIRNLAVKQQKKVKVRSGKQSKVRTWYLSLPGWAEEPEQEQLR